MRGFTTVLIILAIALLGGGAFLFLKGNLGSKISTQDSQKNQVSETPSLPKTEIRAKVRDLEVVISPSNEKVVKGIITLTATKVPNNTEVVAFAIQGGDIESIEKTGPNLGSDAEGEDGWSYLLDTTKYENGLYDIIFIAGKSGGGEPLGGAKAQVVIQN